MSITKKMEGDFLRFLEGHLDPCRPGGLLIGLSGGCDSTALLHLSIATADRHHRAVVVGHVDHGVRPESRAEAERLKEMCLTLGVPFLAERIVLAGPKTSEAEMRHERFKALKKIAQASGCPYVLLGHQQDDQAETVILNLVRGAGLRGLAGISPARGRFIHPLIEVPRSRLRSYLIEKGIPWITDPTNLDCSLARNRVRHRILPMLETELRPGATATIARAASHLRRSLDVIESEAHRCMEACGLPASKMEVRLDGDRLRSYSIGLIEFVLRLAVQSVSGTIEDVSTPAWRAIASATTERRSGRFPLSCGVLVETSERIVRIGFEGANLHLGPEIEVPWTGVTAWRSGVLVTRLRRMRKVPRQLRIRGLTRTQVFDASSVVGPARLRPSRPGDRIPLEDSSRRRLVSDLLSEMGIPRSRRKGQPILEDGQGILWVPAVRRAGLARVGPETKEIWIVRWLGPLPADEALRGGSSRS